MNLYENERSRDLNIYLILLCFSAASGQRRGSNGRRGGGASGEALRSAGSVHLQTPGQQQQGGAHRGLTTTPD